DPDAGLDPGALADDAVVTDHGPLLHHRVVLDGDGAADDRLPELAPLTDVGVRPDHRVGDPGVLVDDRVLVDDHRTGEVGARLELDLVTEEGRALDDSPHPDLHVLPDPDLSLAVPRDVAAHPARQGVPIRLEQGWDVADVAPVALGDESEERLLPLPNPPEDILRP